MEYYFMSSPHDEPLKRRRWEETGEATTKPHPPVVSSSTPSRKSLKLSSLDDEMVYAAVPPVTVVLDGRSICHRIHLHKHDSYESLAAALRRMFVDMEGGEDADGAIDERRGRLDLSNAVPGYMVAYEDMEDDLLLAGDLNWKDFIRVVKRIRIIPAKPNRWKLTGGSKTVMMD